MIYRNLICWFLLTVCLSISINGGRIKRKAYVPSSNGICWSPWFSDDNSSPRTDLEIETIFVVQTLFPDETCAMPVDIQCRTVDTHIPYNETFENVLCIIEYGLQCIQIRDIECSDYEIRIACPCNITTEDPTITTSATAINVDSHDTDSYESSGSDSVTFYISSSSVSDSEYTTTGAHGASLSGITSEDTSMPTTAVRNSILTVHDMSTAEPRAQTVESTTDEHAVLTTHNQSISESTENVIEPTTDPALITFNQSQTEPPTRTVELNTGVHQTASNMHGNSTTEQLLDASNSTDIHLSTTKQGQFTTKQMVEEKCWTPWLDDERLGISNDNGRVESEKLSTFRRYDSTLVCSEPERIECRRVVDKVPSGDEVSRCDVTYGLQCIGNRDRECADYEIRLLCPTPCHPNGTLFTLTTAEPPVHFLTTIKLRSEEQPTTPQTPTQSTTNFVETTPVENTSGAPSVANTDPIISTEHQTAAEIIATTKLTSSRNTQHYSSESIPLSQQTAVNPTKTDESLTGEHTVTEMMSTSHMPTIGITTSTASVTPSLNSNDFTDSNDIDMPTSKPEYHSTSEQMITSFVELTEFYNVASSTITESNLISKTLEVITSSDMSEAPNDIFISEKTQTTDAKIITDLFSENKTTNALIQTTSTHILETTRRPVFMGCRYNKAGNLTWRRVEINKYRTSQEKCEEGTPRAGMPKGTRYCGTDDDGNAVWMSPTVQDCMQSIRPTTTTKSKEQTEEELVNLSEATITMENVTDVADELTTLTSGVNEVSEEMFNAIADTLENIVNVGSTSIEVTSAVFSSVSNLLSADMGDANVASSSTKIVKAVGTQVDLAQEGQAKFGVKEVNLAALANTNNQTVVEGGLGFAAVQPGGTVGDTGLENTKWRSFQNADAVPSTGVDVSCKIPEEIGTYTGSGSLQISYVIYSNGMLFSSPLTSGVNATSKVMSRVMSVTAKDTKVTNLHDPVELSFGKPQNISDYESATCVYWDFELQDGIGDWSSEGCFINDTKDDVITCYCNHLTHFAVLLRVKEKEIQEDVYLALVLITKIGCLISIACLIATLIAFLSFRRLRCERPQRILISLSVSLLCLYVIFIIGIEPPGREGSKRQQDKCLVSAVLLHYFTLTSMFWMVVEAVNLYYNLIKVFKSKVSLFMLKASIFAWGVPALIVGGMAGWQTTRLEYMNEEYCFMITGLPFYVSLALPVAACILFNIIVFMRVMCELSCRRRQSSNSNESRWKNLSKRAQNAFGISVLLGLAWIFGFLTFDVKHDYIFDVLFCVFNSLQGAFVFMFFCIRQKEVRTTWLRFLCGNKNASYNIGSSSGSSTRYTNRSGRPASANIDLLAKPQHHEVTHNGTHNGMRNGNGTPSIYDYNDANATMC